MSETSCHQTTPQLLPGEYGHICLGFWIRGIAGQKDRITLSKEFGFQKVTLADLSAWGTSVCPGCPALRQP